jgi:hypothetical protein
MFSITYLKQTATVHDYLAYKVHFDNMSYKLANARFLLFIKMYVHIYIDLGYQQGVVKGF